MAPIDASHAGNPQSPENMKQLSYETVVSGLGAQITTTHEGSIIFVAGLRDSERGEISVMADKNSNIIPISDSGESVPRHAITREETTLFNNDKYLRDLFSNETSSLDETTLRQLLRRDDNPKQILNEWLAELRGKSGEHAETGPKYMFDTLMNRLFTLADMRKEVLLEIPANTALGLALLAYAKFGEVNTRTIDAFTDSYSIPADSLASIKIEHHEISAWIAGEKLGSSRTIHASH